MESLTTGPELENSQGHDANLSRRLPFGRYQEESRRDWPLASFVAPQHHV